MSTACGGVAHRLCTIRRASWEGPVTDNERKFTRIAELLVEMKRLPSPTASR